MGKPAVLQKLAN